MAGLSGYIITFAIALCATVIGGTIVQLIRPLYIDRIEDTKSAAQNLTAFFIFTFTSVALAALFYIPFGAALAAGLGLTFGVATARYWLILNCYGGSGVSSEKQAIFATLKERLAEGGLGLKRYELYLGLALDRVDRFFGDDGSEVKTLWPNAFGFRGSKPFWTAPAYDRCMLIALLYPLLVLFVVWGVSGEVGKIEAALQLREGVDEWRRGLFLLALVLTVVAGNALHSAISSGSFRKAIVVAVALIAAGAGAGTGAFDGAGPVAFAVAGGVASSGTFVAAFVGVGAFVGAFVVAFAVAVAAAAALAGAVAFSGAVAVAGAGAVAGAVIYVNDGAHRRLLLGPFLIASSIFYLLLCYGFALWLGATGGWELAGPLLLFFGVLTLVNVSFDWLSIGLTRALLRRGVEAGGFAPVWLALLDLVVATLLIILLAAAIVFAVDLFEVVGRSKIIDVARVLDALADPTQRLEPQYWWIYATLFSTLIPSLLNVALAALSFMRGIIPFHRRVADRMLTGGDIVGTSWWMAPALGLEVVGAAMIGLYLTYLWIFKAVPLLFQPFEWLIPMLRWVAGWV